MDSQRRVAPLSRRQIEEIAGDVRANLGLSPEDRVSMTPLLEQVLYDYFDDYDFHVVEDRLMGRTEGLTALDRPVIKLKHSVYNDLQAGDGRARMTAAHEFGHLLLHCMTPTYYAFAEEYDPLTDPERQANLFAAAFLMPAEAFRQCRTANEATRKFGVSLSAVMCRARKLRHSFEASRPILTLSKEKKERKPMRRAP